MDDHSFRLGDHGRYTPNQLIPLNDPIWQTFRCANGGTDALLPLLLRMGDANSSDLAISDDDWEVLWDTCHQWTTYDSTVATVPHLIDIAESLTAQSNVLTELITLIAASIMVVKNDKPNAPSLAYDKFESSVPAAKRLALQYLERIDSRREMCSGLALLAATNNDLELAGAMLEITDNSIESLNPIGV